VVNKKTPEQQDVINQPIYDSIS